MEHNPNLETKPSEGNSVAGFQDEGGVDTNIVGLSESKESNETTKLKNSNDNAKTLEFGNNNITEIIIQDKESEKNQYICKFCSQVFDKHQALGGHMNGHSKDQRNLEKYGKVTTWIHTTYPPPLNMALASEAELQGIPTNGSACNSSNHLVEVGNVYGQLGGQGTNQQSTQQIQLSQGFQTQQQLQYYQAQELQRYQYSQGLHTNQAPEGLQANQIQNTQALQRPQNFQASQKVQNYQVSQGSPSYQTPQQFQNYQAPQGPQYYQTLQGPQYYQAPQRFQNYQTPQGPQSYQTPQGSQSYQAPQEPQNYQTLQGSQSYQALQGPQSYQTPQGSQSYQALQGSQSYQASQRSQNYQAPQGPQQQLVADANNQQNINLNSKTSNKPTSLVKVPSNEYKNNLSNSQGTHFQEEAPYFPQRYMPNPHNLRNGDRLTTGPFINEQLNKEYYAKLGSNVLMRSNQMISTSHNYDTIAQYKPANSRNTSGSFNQSKDE